MGTFLGVPIIRTIVVGGLYWGTPILGNYHFTEHNIRMGRLLKEQSLQGPVQRSMFVWEGM